MRDPVMADLDEHLNTQDRTDILAERFEEEQAAKDMETGYPALLKTPEALGMIPCAAALLALQDAERLMDWKEPGPVHATASRAVERTEELFIRERLAYHSISISPTHP